MITADLLQRLGADPSWAITLDAAAKRHGIVTARDVSAFLANTIHESQGFRVLQENLYYTTPKRLMEVWPARFKTEEAAKEYVKNPEKLANLVYGYRGDLGNTKPGDGWKFLGRGIIQLTGKFNYVQLARVIGIDLDDLPGFLLTKYGACEAAGAYWEWKQISAAANAGDTVRVRKLVNGGINGLQEVNALYADCLAMLPEGTADV